MLCFPVFFDEQSNENTFAIKILNKKQNQKKVIKKNIRNFSPTPAISFFIPFFEQSTQKNNSEPVDNSCNSIDAN
jgi:hypothetical protein